MTFSQASLLSAFRKALRPASFTLLALLPLGCGTGSGPGSVHTAPASHAFQGKVFGGQQPVVGSQVYLYAAGGSTTGSRSMLTGSGYVTSDSAGGFNITNDYTCQAGDQVYLLALGGNAGSGTNSSIGLMAALGPCSALTPTTYITINEATTVAAAYALSSFITSPTYVGADPVGSNPVAAAFSNVKALVDPSSGMAPSSILGSGIVPQAKLNSLANALAACVNSDVTSSLCASLFSYTGTPSNGNTAQAAISIAHSPSTHAADIFALGDSKPPFEPTLTSAPDTWSLAVAFPGDVLTYHNNAARNGVQSAETTLTPSNVSKENFGKLFTFPVDGQLYAQPLVVGGLGLPDGNIHNVVFAATAHGSIYAFDADGHNSSSGYLWMQSLFAAGESSVLQADYGGCRDTTPEASLLGTPVIDRSTGTLYVVTNYKTGTNGPYFQKLHAISLLDGSEKFGGPTIITATYPGTGDGAASGVLTFDPIKQNQRPALLLANGTVWITWASHCDSPNYHGYVIGYSASDVTQQTVVFNNTPNGSDGGIWMSGGGPSADADGYVYIVGSNGTFDASSKGGLDYGDSALKLSVPTPGSTLPTVKDYFTPFNQLVLSSTDNDAGITNPMLFDDPGSIAPHLMVESDKTGKIYLLNTGKLGGYTGPNNPNADIQEFPTGNKIFNNFAYFNQTMYVGGTSEPLRAYAFQPGNSTTPGTFNTTPTSMSPTTPGGGYSSGGGCAAVSANGTSAGIVWTQDHSVSGSNAPALHAYDATNLATELYNSNQANAKADVMPAAVKFTCPVIANGRVFVGGAGALAVYGLVSDSRN
jgi:hypothetical protein